MAFIDGKAVALDHKQEAENLSLMITGLSNLYNSASVHDQARLQRIGEELVRYRLDLPESIFSDAVQEALMRPLTLFVESSSAGKPTETCLCLAEQAVRLIPAAAGCGPKLLTALRLTPLFCWLLRCDVLEEHKATLEAEAASVFSKAREGVAAEAAASRCELSSAAATAHTFIVPFAKDFATFIGGPLEDFAEHMDQANAQAVKSFKRCVLAAAASTTSSEALGHIASGKAYIRYVFASFAKYFAGWCGPLAAAAPLLEYKPRLPAGLHKACQDTVQNVDQINRLLERTKEFGTLRGSMFGRAIPDEAFISAQLSSLTTTLSPLLVAYNSTAVAASGVVSEQARRVVAAQAQDRQLRVAEATRDKVEALCESVAANAAANAAASEGFKSEVMGLLSTILTNQSAARDAAAGIINSPFKPVNRDGSTVGSPAKEFTFAAVRPS